MSRYLDPTNDVSFRKLFGTEEHKPLLISFLNSILELQEKRQIKEVELLPKDQAPRIKGSNPSVLDIQCTDQRNFPYTIRIENKGVPNFVKRVEFYVPQFAASTDYLLLRPVVLLAITNHIFFPSEEKVISYYEPLGVETREPDLKDLSYAFVELPKFDKNEGELKTIQDQWLYFFKNWSDTKEVPTNVGAEIKEAYRSMEEGNWSQAEKDAYIKANSALVDE